MMLFDDPVFAACGVVLASLFIGLIVYLAAV